MFKTKNTGKWDFGSALLLPSIKKKKRLYDTLVILHWLTLDDFPWNWQPPYATSIQSVKLIFIKHFTALTYLEGRLCVGEIKDHWFLQTVSGNGSPLEHRGRYFTSQDTTHPIFSNHHSFLPSFFSANPCNPSCSVSLISSPCCPPIPQPIFSSLSCVPPQPAS